MLPSGSIFALGGDGMATKRIFLSFMMAVLLLFTACRKEEQDGMDSSVPEEDLLVQFSEGHP